MHSELAPKGIHVGGVYPNLIKTNFLERAIFRGKDAEDIRARRNQVQSILQVPVVEQPQQVASAIWEAVQHQHRKVIVGSAYLSVISNKVFPGLTHWLIRRTFKNQDDK